MDTKINFFKIGLFVSIISFLLLLGVFWLGKYGLEDKKYDRYFINFDESITGLNIGSSIKYKGFDVGVVKNIKINPQNIEQIEIELQIQKGTPIKDDNYGILGNLGITGLKYIELKGGSNEAKLLEENEDGYKIINSKKSALGSLVDSTEDITKELTIILSQIKKALSDDNVENLSSFISKSSSTMSNIEKFSQNLAQNEKKIDELLFKIKDFTSVGTSSFLSVKSSADSFKELTTKMKDDFDSGKFDIKELTQDSLENLNIVLRSLEDNLNQSQDLIRNLNESPSDLLFKQKNIKYGPGEENDK